MLSINQEHCIQKIVDNDVWLLTSMHAKAVGQLRRELVVEQDKSAKLGNDAKVAREANEALKGQLAKAKEMVAERNKTGLALRAKVDEQKAELEVAAAQVAEAKDQAAYAEEQLSKARHELVDARHIIENNKRIIEVNNTTLSRQDSLVAEHEALSDKLRKEIATLKTQLQAEGQKVIFSEGVVAEAAAQLVNFERRREEIADSLTLLAETATKFVDAVEGLSQCAPVFLSRVSEARDAMRKKLT